MKIRKLATTFWVVLFFAFSMFPSSMSVLAETATTAPDAALAQEEQEEPPPQIMIEYEYDNELVTSLYHLYGSVLDDFVNVFLTNNSDETTTLLVETQIEGYTATSADTVNVPPHEQVEVKQNPQLLPDAIDKLNAQHPGNFVIKVAELLEGKDDILLNESQEVTIYSRRDMVWIDGCTQQEEFELIAAWVTPNDPAVEELIRRAADYTDSGIMGNGYSGVLNDEKGYVWDRLQAIWRAEEDYNLIYISTPLAFGKVDWSQRIRTPYEVIDQSSGNCIETACLFASAAEALKLEAAIIYIPGHAYVGVRIDEENADYYFIETTLIGRASFSEAVDMGAQEWEDTSPHLDAQEDGYAWVNIYEAREKGILPMP
jgi:hypothetical protein